METGALLVLRRADHGKAGKIAADRRGNLRAPEPGAEAEAEAGAGALASSVAIDNDGRAQRFQRDGPTIALHIPTRGEAHHAIDHPGAAAKAQPPGSIYAASHQM